MWLVKTNGSGARKVSGGDNGFFPVFSPDGKWLLFRVASPKSSTTDGWTLARSDGEAPRAFDFSVPHVVQAVWSRDSRSVFGFTLERGSMGGVDHIVKRDKEGLRPAQNWSLGSVSVEPSPCAFETASNGFVFLGNKRGRSDLYALQREGVRALTSTGDVVGAGQNARGDILWARVGSGLSGASMLRLFRRRGATVEQLPFVFRGSAPVVSPRALGVYFSPGGETLIVAANYKDGNGSRSLAHEMNLDGSGSHELLRGPYKKLPEQSDLPGEYYVILPRWSVDGKTLCLFSGGTREGGALRVGDGHGHHLLALPFPINYP